MISGEVCAWKRELPLKSNWELLIAYVQMQKKRSKWSRGISKRGCD